MKSFSKKISYLLCLKAAASAIFLLSPTLVLSAQNTSSKAETCEHKEGYTINFNNISIIEYIRFVSRITNTNFVFDENDLGFNITIVSEDPISAQNIMSALTQILRIHGLTILEQENNLLITTSKDVSQISTLITGEDEKNVCNAPILTQVFRIKNANPATVASIIKPMTSSSALIEVSSETRQIIVTDIATNLEKIIKLINTLDTPHNALEVENYVARNVAPAELVTLAAQILQPFSQGSPFIMVPQPETNSVFVVSTPDLLERAVTVLEDLDTPSRGVIPTHTQESVFLYKIQNRSSDDLENGLRRVARELMTSTAPPMSLVDTLEHAKWVKESNSILFVGDTATIAKVKEILVSLDSSLPQEDFSGGPNTFFLYKLQHAQGGYILSNLEKIGENLKENRAGDKTLLRTIREIKWIKESNSLLISGRTGAVDRIKALIAEFDTPGGAFGGGILTEKSSFFIYEPRQRSADEIQNALLEIYNDLKAEGLVDLNLLESLSTVRYVEATNSLLFTGTPTALEKGLLTLVDSILGGASGIQKIGAVNFLLYPIADASAEKAIISLLDLAEELKNNQADASLIAALQSVKWMRQTHSLLFTGSDLALEQVGQLLKKLDLSTSLLERVEEEVSEFAPSSYVIYTPQYQSGEDLIEILCDFKKNLIDAGVANKNLFWSIDHLKWIEKTCSLLVSGEPEIISQVLDLLRKFDAPKGSAPSISAIENMGFLIYKLQYHQGDEIKDALKQVAVDLTNGSGIASQALMGAVNSLQWIKMTNSLLATGDAAILEKLKELIQNLDVPLRQVFIEVLVIETSLINSQAFGLQWGGKAQYFNKVGAGSGNFPAQNPLTPDITPSTTFQQNLAGISATTTPTGASVPFLSGFDLGVIGDIIMHKGKSFVSLGALVNALETDNNSTVIMNPKIIAQDNINSTIFVGQNLPFVGSLVQVTGVASSTNTSLEYKDVGVNLSITPTLGNGDVVTLDITNDITEVINEASLSGSSVSGISTNHTSMSTRVHVPNKNFLALSGMIRDTKERFRSGIPCLGGLPVIGLAFSENDRTDTRNNIIIFVRPQIIDSFEEYQQITEFQETLYKDQASMPLLKEEFDAAVDIIKTPENE